MNTTTEHDTVRTPPDRLSPSASEGLNVCPVCGSGMTLLWETPGLRKHVCDHEEGRVARFENTQSQASVSLPWLVYPADASASKNVRIGHFAKPACPCALCERIANL